MIRDGKSLVPTGPEIYRRTWMTKGEENDRHPGTRGNGNGCGYDNGDLIHSKIRLRFLEAARKHGPQGNSKSSSSISSSNPDKKSTTKENSKSKKTWKNSLIFGRKWGKKSSGWHQEDETKISSPVDGGCGRDGLLLRCRSSVSREGGRAGFSLPRSTSERFNSFCFAPTWTEESEVSYLQMKQHDDQGPRVGAFGPVYLVT